MELLPINRVSLCYSTIVGLEEKLNLLTEQVGKTPAPQTEKLPAKGSGAPQMKSGQMSSRQDSQAISTMGRDVKLLSDQTINMGKQVDEIARKMADWISGTQEDLRILDTRLRRMEKDAQLREAIEGR